MSFFVCFHGRQAKAEEEEVDHTPWGELEPSDEESSEEEEEEESDEEKPDETGFFTPADRYVTSTVKKFDRILKRKQEVTHFKIRIC